MKQKMKQKIGVVWVVLALMITACGANPVEKLEEVAAEQVAETILEQATGVEDIEIDVNNGEASYTFEDENGDTSTISSVSDENIDALVGMGFNIDLPDGVGNGTVQQADENGETLVVSGVFEVDGITLEQFYTEFHPTLTAAGFTFIDTSQSGKTEPDTSDPINSTIVSYEHPDGVVFSVLWGDTDVILAMTKVDVPEDGGDAGGETDVMQTAVSPADAPVTLDGSMSLDKKSYATNETIVVTLVINTPLADNAWVGIVPSDTPHGSESENDAADVTYAYVRNAQDGILILEAPYDAGDYDVRIFNTDSNGVELDSISITVE